MIRENTRPERDYGEIGLAPASSDDAPAPTTREAFMLELEERHNAGALTDADYNAAKAKLLGL